MPGGPARHRTAAGRNAHGEGRVAAAPGDEHVVATGAHGGEGIGGELVDDFERAAAEQASTRLTSPGTSLITSRSMYGRPLSQ